ncbi:Fic family protein [Clavibacter tessellarius]|uniref:Fic family protein n=1 Tax=Clavibacter tessellarius TaxID=31965 RepID=UPI00158520FE|nr:Fic family protein [Clavibacter michiganensis]
METDEVSSRRLEKAQEKSQETHRRAVLTSQRIKSEANAILGPYLVATRSDLVTESNTMEGMRWNKGDVRQSIKDNQALLVGPLHSLTETVRADPKLYEVLGLYRAHEIADTWLEDEHAPRAADIRALHKLILGDVRGSGSYKQFENQIAGRPDHRTTSPNEVGRVMLELSDWWANSTGEPLLTATAVHAWLAHIHPFEDGNGRTARILANIELARHNYPPLLLRADSDRGEYYAALQASDEGDLLPLYELFEKAIRRQSKLMARSTYLQEIIDDRLLSSIEDKYNLWQASLNRFSVAMAEHARRARLNFTVQGTLSLEEFGLLLERDSAGNGWYAKISHGRQEEWLLWFGFQTLTWNDMSADASPYPSIFISRRDANPKAIHPFSPTFETQDLEGQVWDEMQIIPARANPVLLRTRFDMAEVSPEAAASALIRTLGSGFSV